MSMVYNSEFFPSSLGSEPVSMLLKSFNSYSFVERVMISGTDSSKRFSYRFSDFSSNSHNSSGIVSMNWFIDTLNLDNVVKFNNAAPPTIFVCANYHGLLSIPQHSFIFPHPPPDNNMCNPFWDSSELLKALIRTRRKEIKSNFFSVSKFQ
ncbi:hypothetical protein CMV_018593 [Castanea mollissima]|nr:hypothetical protein CMV_018593 [Castanea mollissima]